MGNMLICAPNFLKNTFTEPVFCGGSWNISHYLTELQTRYFINQAISTSAAEANTRFHVDFQELQPMKFFGVANSNITAVGQIRASGTATIAWNGVTVNGAQSIGDNTLAISASGQANIQAGQGFTIAGDTNVYNVSVGIGLGENRMTDSDDFSAWTATNITVFSDAGDDPSFGRVDSDFIVPNTTVAEHKIDDTFTATSGVSATVSIYVAPENYSRVHLLCGSAGNYFAQGVDLSDGSLFDSDIAGVTNATVSSAELTNDGFYRIQITFTTAATSNILRLLVDGSASGASNTSFAGDGIKGVYVWGAQAVEGTDALDYVRTSGGAATTSGTITIVRAAVAGTGLVVAVSGGEVLTAHCGNFLKSTLFDTGVQNYYPVVYEDGTLSWGEGGLWDGRETEQTLEAFNRPRQWVYVLTDSTLVQYQLVQFFDASNADPIAIDKIYMTSVYRPTNNMDYNAVFGIQSNTTSESSAGGVEVYQSEQAQRYCEFTLSNITVEEAFTNIFDLQTQLDISEDFFYIFDEDDDLLLSRRSFPANFEGLGGIRSTFYNVTGSTHRVKEKLA